MTILRKHKKPLMKLVRQALKIVGDKQLNYKRMVLVGSQETDWIKAGRNEIVYVAKLSGVLIATADYCQINYLKAQELLRCFPLGKGDEKVQKFQNACDDLLFQVLENYPELSATLRTLILKSNPFDLKDTDKLHEVLKAQVDLYTSTV